MIGTQQHNQLVFFPHHLSQTTVPCVARPVSQRLTVPPPAHVKISGCVLQASAVISKAIATFSISDFRCLRLRPPPLPQYLRTLEECTHVRDKTSQFAAQYRQKAKSQTEKSCLQLTDSIQRMDASEPG